MPDGVQTKRTRARAIANIKRRVIESGGREPCLTSGCHGLTNSGQFGDYCGNCMHKLAIYGSTWHKGYNHKQLRAKREEAYAIIKASHGSILCHQKAIDFTHALMQNAQRFEPAYRKTRFNTKDAVANWFASLRYKMEQIPRTYRPMDYRRELIVRWICVYLVLAEGSCPRSNKFRRAALARTVFRLGTLPRKKWPGYSEHDKKWNNQKQSVKLTGIQRQLLGELAEECLWKMGLDWPEH